MRARPVTFYWSSRSNLGRLPLAGRESTRRAKTISFCFHSGRPIHRLMLRRIAQECAHTTSVSARRRRLCGVSGTRRRLRVLSSLVVDRLPEPAKSRAERRLRPRTGCQSAIAIVAVNGKVRRTAPGATIARAPATAQRSSCSMQNETLTLTDNRTGQTNALPLFEGNIRATDLRQIKVHPDDFMS